MCDIKPLLACRRQVKELEAQIASLTQTNEALKKQLTPPEPPAIKGVISASEVRALYAQLFPEDMDKLFISDINYEITAISEIRRFIDWDNIDTLTYVPEILDCDDFALALAGSFAKCPGWSGFPVSFIWGDLYNGHAFATCVAWRSFEDRTPVVYFIEPQNDHELARETVAEMKLWLLPMSRIK